MNSSPRSIKTLLHTVNPELGVILRHAEHLRRVRTAVIKALPDAAADHIHVADISPQQLILHTDNTGWATRLRYAEPAIRRILAQCLRLHVEHIKVRVRPSLARPTSTPVERQISRANRDYIKRVAGYIDDAELTRALLALATQGDTQHTRK